MAHNRSVSPELSRRYARALIDLAEERKVLQGVEADVVALSTLFETSKDFAFFIKSAAFSRSVRIAALSAISEKVGFQTETLNFLSVLVDNHRLYALPVIITAVQDLLRARRGQVVAHVQTVHALTQTQSKALVKDLSELTGQAVVLDAQVNKDLIGGLVVTIGSTRVDGSVSGRLERLRQAMNKRASDALNDNTVTVKKKEA